MKPSGARVVVLSLQRLGDVLTAGRVTDALASREGTASVEVVCWDATAAAARLLPGVSKVHTLPFNGLRARGEIHPLAAVGTLRERLRAIRGDGADTIVNLTSTRFACYVAPLLAAQGATMYGPFIDDHERYIPTHPAIAYMNNCGSDPDLNVFAHRDLYSIAARVRLSGFPGLPGNPIAESTVEHGVPALAQSDKPIAVHIHGSETAKDWRPPLAEDGWKGLITLLRRRYGREVFVMGGPKEQKELGALAEVCGAELATWALGPSIALIRRCCALISVDTVAIHAAAGVGTPSIVLRSGPARGYAFVPGTHSLIVEHDGAPPSAGAVAALFGAHVIGHPIAPERTAELSDLRIREGVVEDNGIVGLRRPGWLPADAEAENLDSVEQSWREVWGASFFGFPAPPAALAHVRRSCTDADIARRASARGSSAVVAGWLEATPRKRGRAA